MTSRIRCVSSNCFIETDVPLPEFNTYRDKTIRNEGGMLVRLFCPINPNFIIGEINPFEASRNQYYCKACKDYHPTNKIPSIVVYREIVAVCKN